MNENCWLPALEYFDAVTIGPHTNPRSTVYSKPTLSTAIRLIKISGSA